MECGKPHVLRCLRGVRANPQGCLEPYGPADETGQLLEEEDEDKLQLMTVTLSHPKVPIY